MARVTRRQIAGTATQVLYALADLSPANPANIKRLALVDPFRRDALRGIAYALQLAEEGLRDEAFEDLTRLLDEAKSMRDRARTEAP